ncbi:protein patched homolog 3-like [Trichogramma pretiosum]|uniref:protein patched homolog 3-like n=1 Tax=Trichogramma pretiosum TaxID=7493 RepID=UPI0006C9712B|nr:protein patched homolog 3-like [Trichogramma pretiosum]XP_014230060.1 protein patched homolog 3-like [Trichogramma pretiosum]XP_023314289.1 protein patched homolog 3-like [Trichogramma pretiosum]
MDRENKVFTKLSTLEKLYRVPRVISNTVEKFFYNLGLQIAKNPRKWMSGCIIVIIACIAGLLRFRQEKNPLKLWVPPDSDFVRDTEWLMSTFKEGQRIENFIFAAEDILQPDALMKLNEITLRIFNAQTNSQPKLGWTDVCFKVPIISGVNGMGTRRKRGMDDDFFDNEPTVVNKPGYDAVAHLPPEVFCPIYNSLAKGCLLFSIMDIWEFNSTLIKSQTKEDIVSKFNSVNISPTLGHPLNYSQLLGGITRDEEGRIISAKVVKTQWTVYVNFSLMDMNEMGNDAGTADWSTKEVHEWEAVYLKELESVSSNMKGSDSNYSLYYEAGRSFGDISQDSIFHDAEKLAAGIILMSLYVQVVLSRFNWVEWRFWLTSVSLFSIGGAFVVAIGLCSLFGVPYGPVHTSLPFMLMGLGVDDTFVMMAAWDEVASRQVNLKKPLVERVALTLSHAGAAISVTSLTDVVAFVIGASTILPSLNSFCIYAAVGVMVTYLLQVTFFVAFFTLDCRRVEQKRNGVLPCCVSHPNFVPTPIDAEHSLSWRLIDKLFGKVILTLPGKIIVLALTVGFATFGALGSMQLEQWFDPVWFLPKESYLAEYLVVKQQEFPKVGSEATAFVSEVDFRNEFGKILNLSRTLEAASFVDDVKTWPIDFVTFCDANFNVDAENATLSESDFRLYLSKFLFSRSGGKYQRNFHFEKPPVCGQPTPKLKTVSIDFTFAHFSAPYEWIPAMDNAKETMAQLEFDGLAIVWSEMFATWVTDKVISQEVLRNLMLALICVMGMTAFLIAEPQTVGWILLCVLLTLLDVCGFMYYWGLTIDIVSCIGLELAVGLSVDYAAHVAHAFLNAHEVTGAKNRLSERSARALKAVRHIGAAVLFGAGSTLLALSLLSTSKAYVFRAFFKIFLLVIVFGLFHGLLLLPVVLSTIGPRSLKRKLRGDESLNGGAQELIEAATVPLNKE